MARRYRCVGSSVRYAKASLSSVVCNGLCAIAGGARPFDNIRDRDTIKLKLNAHFEKKCPEILKFPPHTPKKLEQIVLSCWEYQADKRATMEDIVEVRLVREFILRVRVLLG